MIYLDSCAVIKLLVPEAESAALASYLTSANEPWVSSEVIVVEIHRALIRLEVDEQIKAQAAQLLHALAKISTSRILEEASRLPGKHLRSLDALHLATALHVSPRQFITYDSRLSEEANNAGLDVFRPA
ncbi:MAG: type II toxin-antitoxin system VapC family toxin [Candidatus Dormibacteraceae bacterium]